MECWVMMLLGAFALGFGLMLIEFIIKNDGRIW